MVSDDRLLTDEFTETLGMAAEPLSAKTRSEIRVRVMRDIRSSKRGGLFVLSHRVAAAATALAMLSGGVAYAAERSLPNDPLYGLKIAAENTAVAILPPGRLENRVLVNIAARRAGEAARLAHRGSEPETMDEALGSLRKAVRQATPAESPLAEEDANRIQKRGADAPEQTREAIEDAVSAPIRPTAPQGDSRPKGDLGEQPQGDTTQDTTQGAKDTGVGDVGEPKPTQKGMDETREPEQSRGMDGSGRGR